MILGLLNWCSTSKRPEPSRPERSTLVRPLGGEHAIGRCRRIEENVGAHYCPELEGPSRRNLQGSHGTGMGERIVDECVRVGGEYVRWRIDRFGAVLTEHAADFRIQAT